MKRTAHRKRQQSGIALIMVLGLVIFLTLIALPFSENQRVSTQVAVFLLLGNATFFFLSYLL